MIRNYCFNYFYYSYDYVIFQKIILFHFYKNRQKKIMEDNKIVGVKKKQLKH